MGSALSRLAQSQPSSSSSSTSTRPAYLSASAFIPSLSRAKYPSSLQEYSNSRIFQLYETYTLWLHTARSLEKSGGLKNLKPPEHDSLMTYKSFNYLSTQSGATEISIEAFGELFGHLVKDSDKHFDEFLAAKPHDSDAEDDINSVHAANGTEKLYDDEDEENPDDDDAERLQKFRRRQMKRKERERRLFEKLKTPVCDAMEVLCLLAIFSKDPIEAKVAFLFNCHEISPPNAVAEEKILSRVGLQLMVYRLLKILPILFADFPIVSKAESDDYVNDVIRLRLERLEYARLAEKEASVTDVEQQQQQNANANPVTGVVRDTDLMYDENETLMMSTMPTNDVSIGMEEINITTLTFAEFWELCQDTRLIWDFLSGAAFTSEEALVAVFHDPVEYHSPRHRLFAQHHGKKASLHLEKLLKNMVLSEPDDSSLHEVGKADGAVPEDEVGEVDGESTVARDNTSTHEGEEQQVHGHSSRQGQEDDDGDDNDNHDGDNREDNIHDNADRVDANVLECYETSRHPLWQYCVMDLVNESWLSRTPELGSEDMAFTALEHLALSGKPALPVIYFDSVESSGVVGQEGGERGGSSSSKHSAIGLVTSSSSRKQKQVGAVDLLTMISWLVSCLPASIQESVNKIQSDAVTKLKIIGDKRKSLAISSARRASNMGATSSTIMNRGMGSVQVGSLWQDTGMTFATSSIRECLGNPYNTTNVPKIEQILNLHNFLYDIIYMVATGHRNLPVASSKLFPFKITHFITTNDVVGFLACNAKELLGKTADLSVSQSGLIKKCPCVQATVKYGEALALMVTHNLDSIPIVDEKDRLISRLLPDSLIIMWVMWYQQSKRTGGDIAEYLDTLKASYARGEHSVYNGSNQVFNAFTVLFGPLKFCDSLGVSLKTFEEVLDIPLPEEDTMEGKEDDSTDDEAEANKKNKGKGKGKGNNKLDPFSDDSHSDTDTDTDTDTDGSSDKKSDSNDDNSNSNSDDDSAPRGKGKMQGNNKGEGARGTMSAPSKDNRASGIRNSILTTQPRNISRSSMQGGAASLHSRPHPPNRVPPAFRRPESSSGPGTEENKPKAQTQLSLKKQMALDLLRAQEEEKQAKLALAKEERRQRRELHQCIVRCNRRAQWFKKNGAVLPTDSLRTALYAMCSSRSSRALVVSETGTLLGAISLVDICKEIILKEGMQQSIRSEKMSTSSASI